MPEAAPPGEMSWGQKLTVLVAAFLGWTFAGLQIALFVLIHRPAMISLMTAAEPTATAAVDEQAVTQWFAWYQAAFLLGAAAGGWVFGILGDRWGRTRTLALSILCYSVFTGACYFATSPLQLLVLRFLACHGIGGAWPNTVALVAEAWPAASRPFLAGILGTAANIGQVLMGLLGLGFDVTPASWRWTFLAGAAPALVGLWCLVGVPESALWRRAREKPSGTPKGPLRELFQPPLRYRTVIGILLGAIPVIGTAANAQWLVPWSDQVQAKQQVAQVSQLTSGPLGAQPSSALSTSASNSSSTPSSPTPLARAPLARAPLSPTTSPTTSSATESSASKSSAATTPATKPARPKADPKSKARTMISRSGGAVLGSLMGGMLATLLGRRLTYFLISLLTFGASSLIFGWLNPLHPWFLWASFGFGLVGTIYFGWLPLYLPELFPTRVRASGTGISFNTGRAVAAVVALGTGVIVQGFGGDYARIGWWTGMIYMAGMVIILFAPRTETGRLQDE